MSYILGLSMATFLLTLSTILRSLRAFLQGLSILTSSSNQISISTIIFPLHQTTKL
jgi:hypothetical protein